MTDNVSTLESGLRRVCRPYADRRSALRLRVGFIRRAVPGVTTGLRPRFPFASSGCTPTRGARRGVVARVVEPGFVYDGFWLVSMTRHLGVWNFTDRPAAYNLLLCPEQPVEGREEDSPEYGRFWPVWHLRGQPQASGFGRIAETLQCCVEYDARLIAEAEQKAAKGGRD